MPPLNINRVVVALLAAAIVAPAGTGAVAHAGVTVVSVGDSYSSGEGTAPYDAETDRRDHGHKCHRSSGAWPRLAGATASTHLACSDARIANVNGKSGQTSRGADAQPQLPRLTALRNAQAIDYATITIGGNDLGFADKLEFCYLWGNVRGCLKDRDALKRSLNSLRPRLAGLYRDVNMATRGGTTLVVGYPDIFPAPERGDRCVWLTKAMKENIEWFSGQLDSTISAAARDAGVSFLSVRNVFNGHELCTAKSWVRTLGGKPGDVTRDQQQGHPLKEGQNALAAEVLKWMRSHPRPSGAVPTAPAPVTPAAPGPPPAPAAPRLAIQGSCTSAGGTLAGVSGGFSPGGTATIRAWYPDGRPYTNLIATSGVRADGSIGWTWPCAGDPAGTYATEAIDNATGASTGRVSFTVGAPQPAPPTTRTIVVDNRVTNGGSQMREDTPAYLSTVMQNFCKRNGCALSGTDMGSGATITAECTSIGARTTNGQDNSAIDDGNPGLFSSTRWYGIRWGDGRFGYISEVWIRGDFRGGLGLRGC